MSRRDSSYACGQVKLFDGGVCWLCLREPPTRWAACAPERAWGELFTAQVVAPTAGHPWIGLRDETGRAFWGWWAGADCPPEAHLELEGVGEPERPYDARAAALGSLVLWFDDPQIALNMAKAAGSAPRAITWWSWVGGLSMVADPTTVGRLARRGRRHGLEPDDQDPGWRSRLHGVEATAAELDELVPWAQVINLLRGYSPYPVWSSRTWAGAGFAPKTARNWIDVGVSDPRAAGEWLWRGADAAAAGAYMLAAEEQEMAAAQGLGAQWLIDLGFYPQDPQPFRVAVEPKVTARVQARALASWDETPRWARRRSVRR